MYGGGDYGGNEYGGASQFAGGGFMPSTPAPAGGGGAGSAYSPAAGGGRPNTTKSIFPVTVREMATAGVPDQTENSIAINGHEVTNMVLVGQVVCRNNRETHAEVTVDDGTGRVEVKYWTTDTPTLQGIQEGSYVRVHGHVRMQNGKRSIMAHSIRPVTDMNEVTFHYLNVIFVFMHTGKNAPDAAGGMDASPAGNHQYQQQQQQQQRQTQQAQQQSQQQPSSYNQYVPAPVPAHGGGASAASASAAAAGAGAAAASGVAGVGGSRATEVRMRVQQFYEDPQNACLAQGITYLEASQSLPAYSYAEIKEAVDFHVLEGQLYSTIDDEHFRTTSAG